MENKSTNRSGNDEKKRSRTWLGLLACLFLAFLMWVYVVYEEVPTTTKLFSNLRVESVSGADVLAGRDLTIYEKNITVSVKLSGKRSTLAKLSRSDIRPSLDVSGITEAGEQRPVIKLSGVPESLSVESIKTAGKLEIDNLVSLPAAVDVVKGGKLDASLEEETLTVDPASVTITGPEKLLKNVTVCTEAVNVSDIKKSETMYAPNLIIKDASGAQISPGLIKIYSEGKVVTKANVTVYCLKNKKVPVSEPEIEGTLEGIVIDTISPMIVTVTGPIEAVDRIESVSSAPIPAEDIYAGGRFSLPLALEDGVTCNVDEVTFSYAAEPQEEETEETE